MPVAIGFLSIQAVCSETSLHKISVADDIHEIGSILIYVVRCNILHRKSGGISLCSHFLANGIVQGET